MEAKIHDAEQLLEAKKALLEHPEVVTDGARLQQISEEMNHSQSVVDKLYHRWTELEAKLQ